MDNMCIVMIATTSQSKKNLIKKMTENTVLYKMRAFKRSGNTFEPLDDYAYRARYPIVPITDETISQTDQNTTNRAKRIVELKTRIQALEMELAREMELKDK